MHKRRKRKKAEKRPGTGFPLQKESACFFSASSAKRESLSQFLRQKSKVKFHISCRIQKILNSKHKEKEMRILKVMLSLLLCAPLIAGGAYAAYADGKEMSQGGEMVISASAATRAAKKIKDITDTSGNNGEKYTGTADSAENGYRLIAYALAKKYAEISVSFPNGAPNKDIIKSALFNPECLYLSDSDQFDINSIDIETDEYTASVKATYAETAAYKKLADAKISSIVKSLMLKGSDAAKIKKIHDYIAMHVKYYNGSKPANSAYNAAAEGASKCAGFTELFSVMCQKAGIRCLSVTGTVDDVSGTGRHAWNVVKASGKWYWVDTTWDQAYYREVGDADWYNMQPLKKLWEDHHLDADYKTYYNYCISTVAKTVQTYNIKSSAIKKSKSAKKISKKSAKKKSTKKSAKKENLKEKHEEKEISEKEKIT